MEHVCTIRTISKSMPMYRVIMFVYIYMYILLNINYVGAVSSSKRLLETGTSAFGLNVSVPDEISIATGGGGFFSQLWGEKSATQRWVNGEMSNFEV